jgi:hypothetical protein
MGKAYINLYVVTTKKTLTQLGIENMILGMAATYREDAAMIRTRWRSSALDQGPMRQC